MCGWVVGVDVCWCCILCVVFGGVGLVRVGSTQSDVVLLYGCGICCVDVFGGIYVGVGLRLLLCVGCRC